MNTIESAKLEMPDGQEHVLFGALLAYAEGTPVVVLTTEGGLLHGAKSLRAIVDTGAPLECRVIHGISAQAFDASDWPEMLEAARQMFMTGKQPSAEYLAWVRARAI